MSDHFNQVADAFSRKAIVYDAFGEGHAHLTRMRHKVYDHISHLHPKGSYLLELNAGTGFDAVQLLQRGYRIHATDLADGMINQIQQKIETYQLQEQLTAQQCSFTQLDQVTAGPFDGVYSNFGGLNCIPDLKAVTQHLPRLLKPNGLVTWVIMPPICPWELTLTLKDPRVGTRRLRPKGVTAHVEGVHFTTTYFTVNQTKRAFGSQFTQARLEGLSIVTPTADNDRFANEHPRLYKKLTQLDDWLAHKRPFNRIGDFFILSMRYTG